jgi:sterol desaturase/sphingolipid hydroxylase (fatty acid hydroxylase superfamily)
METPLMPNLPEHSGMLRLAAFLSIFGILALVETTRPRRSLTVSKLQRWRSNLGITMVNTLALRLLFPLAPAGMATLAHAHQWGLFNLIKLPGLAETVASLLALDLIIYLQHRQFHRVTFLWRLHRMHHTDLDLDVSSGTRFHPFEMALSTVIKLAAVALLGSSAFSVLLFEILLNATSLFNHANIRIPVPVDRILRTLLVTPDMHRVHHSVLPQETDSNFGFNLPWWDRLFGTYRAQPRDGHDSMVIGLKEFREIRQLGLRQLLMIPFAPLPFKKAQ